ncbi:hypothetical protein BIT28_21905 [Photobacterium proteolyticum]|uniref:Uncharacterized protein n=1 Tax=Photobacterium proteolyticum TaxID=1903952 RepID=A0A1Q9GG29_9GAMM|nr:hypothetical protein BIT28_21905 [Photobacterium proteolyticum]
MYDARHLSETVFYYQIYKKIEHIKTVWNIGSTITLIDCLLTKTMAWDDCFVAVYMLQKCNLLCMLCVALYQAGSPA